MKRITARIAFAMAITYVSSPTTVKACFQGFLNPVDNTCVCSRDGPQDGWDGCNNGADGQCFDGHDACFYID
jgi:hypothetical protein